MSGALEFAHIDDTHSLLLTWIGRHKQAQHVHIPKHTLEALQVIVVKRGQITLTIDAATVTISGGHIAIAPRGSTLVGTGESNRADIIWIGLNTSDMARWPGHLTAALLDCLELLHTSHSTSMSVSPALIDAAQQCATFVLDQQANSTLSGDTPRDEDYANRGPWGP